jgi:hypothetical protein
MHRYILQGKTFKGWQFNRNQANNVPAWNKAVWKVDASDVLADDSDIRREYRTIEWLTGTFLAKVTRGVGLWDTFLV